MTLTAPSPLAENHVLRNFCSGVASLDDWVRRRAMANQSTGASRTYVVCEGDRVVGYYALASGAVQAGDAPGRFSRNMPNPIPVALLARLAIDLEYQGRGLGKALVRDGARRVLHAADILGIRGLVVHAISDEARQFYQSLGFTPSPLDHMTLMVTLAELKRTLS